MIIIILLLIIVIILRKESFSNYNIINNIKLDDYYKMDMKMIIKKMFHEDEPWLVNENTLKKSPKNKK